VADLEGLREVLIQEAVRTGVVSEGIVMTEGPPAYRRLDADKRALAYVRVRSRRVAVRVDVSGLWALPDLGWLRKIREEAAQGLTLWVHDGEEAQTVGLWLRAVVGHHRALEAERSERVGA
jgi:hypothetical protein